VDELMRVSDIVVTKAGGISLTEALVLQTAIIAVNPIPGQEKLNSDLFADLNIAKTAKNKEEAFEFINWLIDHPEGLKSMKDNSKQLAKADAAKEVVRFAKRIA
jgi:processive 1,2-diacylglycerol beta-glucosyltransferase